ncbi:hypothetical protein D9M71_393850 [compost metagenome]
MSGQGAGGVLEAEHPQLFRGRADEGDVGSFAGFGECGVFREEAVTGMDRRGAAGFGDGEDFIDRQVRAGGGAFPEAVRLVGLQDVQAGRVGFRVNGDPLHVQFTQGPQDAAGNGATVGNQDFFEHGITPGGDCASASTGMRAVPQFFERHRGRPRWQNQFVPKHHWPHVGASLLAMVVNDYA